MIYRTKQILFSSLAICGAMCLSLMIHHGLSMLFATIAGYHPELGLKGLVGLPVHYDYWTFEKVFLVHVFPSMLCIAFAFVVLEIKRFGVKKIPFLKLFLFWLALCLTSILTANVILSFFGFEKYNSDLYRGFAMMNSWLYLNRFWVIILGLMSVFLQYSLGNAFLRDFMVFIGSQQLADSVIERGRYMLFMFVIPFILSLVFYLFITYPKEVEYGLLRFGLVGLSMLGAGLIAIGPNAQTLVEEIDLKEPKGFTLVPLLGFIFYGFWYFFL